MSCSTTGYIYIVKLDRYYKIGRTKNFRTRFGEYTRLYKKPKVIIVRRCANYTEVEKKLHKKFANYNSRGEWFRLNFIHIIIAKIIIYCNSWWL